jgi:hypothetical protein
MSSVERWECRVEIPLLLLAAAFLLANRSFEAA